MNDYLLDIRQFSNNTTTEIRQCRDGAADQCGVKEITTMIENLQAVKLFAQIRYRQYSNLCHTIGAFAVAEKFSAFSDQLAEEENTLANLITGSAKNDYYQLDPMEGKYSLCSVPASVNTMIKDKLTAERIAQKTTLMVASFTEPDYREFASSLNEIAEAESHRINELENLLDF